SSRRLCARRSRSGRCRWACRALKSSSVYAMSPTCSVSAGWSTARRSPPPAVERKKSPFPAQSLSTPTTSLSTKPPTASNCPAPPREPWLAEMLVHLHAAGKTLITATPDLGIVPIIADRVLVFSEDHTLVAEGPSRAILADTALLLSVNLIHEHLHRHGDL